MTGFWICSWRGVVVIGRIDFCTTWATAHSRWLIRKTNSAVSETFRAQAGLTMITMGWWIYWWRMTVGRTTFYTATWVTADSLAPPPSGPSSGAAPALPGATTTTMV